MGQFLSDILFPVMLMKKWVYLSGNELSKMNDPATQEIRIALDEVLRERHMTRYQLSKLISMHYQTIDNYYKNCVDRYDGTLLLKMCLALNCEVGELVRTFYAESK